MRYRPDLDGIRAIAVLAVMAIHTGVWYCTGGWMGVDVFFVLSGFLITTLLVDEHARTGNVLLRKFYGRRILRLYPALVVVLTLFGVLYVVGLGYGPSGSVYGSSAMRSLFYIEDFSAGQGYPDAFHHAWSLSVEEQFYLLWPPLLLVLLRFGRKPIRWAIGGVLLSWAACAYTIHQGAASLPAASFYPWNRAGQLLMGAVLALALAGGMRVPRMIQRTTGGLVGALAAVGLVVAGSFWWPFPHLAWEGPAIAIATCAVILHLTANEASPLRAMLGCGPLRWLGRRSYAVYLIHLPLLYWIQTHIHTSLRLQCALMVGLTIALAAVSYRFVEMPFLRLKARLQTASTRSDPAADHKERGGAHTYSQVGIALQTK